MDQVAAESVTGELLWTEPGIGYLDVPLISYDAAYWSKYLGYDDTDMGRALTAARVSFVRSLFGGIPVDIGIGGGAFVRAMPAYGYDVNEHAQSYLQATKRWFDPYHGPMEAITCWDSLEHIPDPAPLLRNVHRFVFVSMPIYRDRDHCLQSKHYRPGEHVWYFTHAGLVRWMEAFGFELVTCTDFEMRAGREDIWSYAFERRGR